MMILKDRNLYLTGMMGSGKTTVGRILSRWLGVQFIDIDEELERRTGQSVAQIFEEKGEAYFRKLEKNVLKEIASTSGHVVATGGGALLDPENREVLNRSGFLIYLHADLKTLAERLKRSAIRPLLKSRSTLSALHSIWNHRKHVYEAVPRKVLAVSDPEHVAQHVLFSLPPVYEILWKGRENVFLGFNLLPFLFERLDAGEFTNKVFVVSHRKLYDQYRDMFINHLSPERKLIPILLPEGERTKDFRYVKEIYKRFMQNRADRRTPVIIFGGGVLGDVVGFAASTFMRGIPLFQVPTSFLAQVDSSLGGKNGVNMNGIKNIIGTFYFPHGTYIDLLFLLSLSSKEISSGIAEVIKAGLIGDPDLFRFVEEHCVEILERKLPVLHEVVRRSALIKLKIVESDPYEKGQRIVLNLGHTIAHGIEGATGFTRISHGEAVSFGMILETRLAEILGIAEKGLRERLSVILSRFHLPTKISGLHLESILDKISLDKKHREQKIVFVLPKKVGEFQVVAIENLKQILPKLKALN